MISHPLFQTSRNKQGLAIKIAMDGLYFCPDVVERLLHPKEGEIKKVLDVGKCSFDISVIYSE
jgi:hypothetical protein